MKSLIKLFFFYTVFWTAELNLDVLASDPRDLEENKPLPTSKNQSYQWDDPTEKNSSYHNRVVEVSNLLKEAELKSKTEQDVIKGTLKREASDLCFIAREYNSGLKLGTIPEETLQTLDKIQDSYRKRPKSPKTPYCCVIF